MIYFIRVLGKYQRLPSRPLRLWGGEEQADAGQGTTSERVPF